jgi:hypothetical protein
MNIDDYTMPGFCSGDKPIIGMMNDFENLAKERQRVNNETDILELLEQYKKNHLLEHEVSYHKDQFLRGVHFIDIRHIDKDNYTWRHFNIWDCPYDFFAREVEAERVMFRRYSTIYIASKIKFSGLTIQSPGNDLRIDHTWGYPGIYSFDGDVMKTNVYLVEKTFHKMEFNNALKYFNGDIELKPAIDEILGDG